MLIHIQFIFIPILLGLAALFAAAEASLFSLSRGQLESLRESKPSVYKNIRSLIFRPDALLSTLIIGNECLNIGIGMMVTSLLESSLPHMSDSAMVLLSVFSSAFLLLSFSEILPKIIAFRMPTLLASILVFPMSWFHWVLTPFRNVFLAISGGTLRALGIQVAPPAAISEEDFLTLVEVGEESGSLDKDEREMIKNVFSFSDLSVSAILTPWNKVTCLEEHSPVEQILKTVKEHPFSRIPVYSSVKHSVVGILYAKELLKLLIEANKGRENEIIQHAIFPAYIVSGHKKVSKLFREFKSKKVHMALVVDEFGKQMGIVTLEDVLNAIFRTQATRKKGEPA